MKKITLMVIAMMGFAACVMADDLLYNGEFKRLNAKGEAVGWSTTVTKGGSVKFFTTGAPDGGYAQFVLTEEGTFSMRQSMMKVLKPNTKYKVSFKLRGENFSAKNLGLVFINEGWSKSSGFNKLVPTPQWKEYEQVIATPDYKKYVAIAFHAVKAKGTVEIADIEVEELDND